MGSKLKPLPASTVRLIGSGQVISSVFSVVKELVENSLDAGATSLEIKLEKYGLEKIEIRDNGCGIHAADAPYMGQRHFTSKIKQHEDLDSLNAYGFRGEALASLCAVSEVTVTTRTDQDVVSTVYTLDHSGHITSTKPSHLGQGTTILACHLFKNLPVRRQYYNSVNKKKEELKKIDDLIMAYGVIRPDVRISLRHNKDVIWQKNVVADHRTVLLQCLGATLVRNMEHIVLRRDTDNEIEIEAFLPKSDFSPQIASRTSCDRFFLYVNKRPVVLKEIEKLVKKYYQSSSGCEGNRCPFAFINLTVPPCRVDVNIDPNKTKVFLHQKEDIFDQLERLLEQIYGSVSCKDRTQGLVDKSQGNDLESMDVGMPEGKNILATQYSVEENSKTTDCNVITHSDGGCLLNNNKRQVDNDEQTYQIEFIDGQRESFTGQGEKEKSLSMIKDNLNEERNSQPVTSVNGAPDRFYSTQEPNFDLIGEEFSCLMDQTQTNGCQKDKTSNQTEGYIGESSNVRKDNNAVVQSTNHTKCDKGQLSNDRKDYIAPEASACDGLDNDDDDRFFDELLKDSNIVTSPSEQQSFEKAFDFQTPSPPLKLSSGRISSMDERRTVLASAGIEDERLNISSVNIPVESSVGDHRNGQGMTIDNWSKGRGLEGRSVQPVTLLQPPALLSARKPLNISRLSASPSSSGTPNRRTSSNSSAKLMTGQQTLYDLIDSQPVKIQHRTQPNVKRRKINEVTESTEQRKPTASEVEIWKTKKSVRISFSVQNLRKRFDCYHNAASQTETCHETPRVIGPLKSHGAWLCCRGNNILVFNHHRAQEVILFHRLLETYNFEMESLEMPIEIKESMFPESALWDTLLSMQQTLKPPDPHVYLTDKRLTANGFDIRMYDDDAGMRKVVIHQMAACLPFYGIQDLIEITRQIRGQAQGQTQVKAQPQGQSKLLINSETLGCCRPQKVKHYLQGEAVRMARQAPCNVSRDEIEDILFHLEADEGSSHDKLSSEQISNAVCLHDKKIWHVLHYMLDCNLSQWDESDLISQD